MEQFVYKISNIFFPKKIRKNRKRFQRLEIIQREKRLEGFAVQNVCKLKNGNNGNPENCAKTKLEFLKIHGSDNNDNPK